MRWLLLVVAWGCGGDPPKPLPPTPQPPVTPLAAHTLAPPAANATVYPTRVCVEGTTLVVENDCGCDDALICTVAGSAAPTLALTLATDPTRMPHCTDCFPMVPGRCALPALAAGSWSVTINGQRAFDLTAPLPGGSCWTLPR